MILSTIPFKIECPATYTSTYASEWPFLSWISEPNCNNKAIQITPWDNCREGHIRELKNHFTELILNNKKTCFALRKNYLKKETPPKQWAGVVSYNNRSIKAAIRVLNLIEKRIGWTPTTITKVNVNGAVSKHFKFDTYLVTGPIEWMKAIPLMSLYLLIIRSCWFIEFHRIKQIEDIEIVCKQVIKKKAITIKGQKDIANIKISYKYWLLLILNAQFMFEKRNHRDLYQGNNSAMGITELVTESTYIDAITLKRWKKLIAKNTK